MNIKTILASSHSYGGTRSLSSIKYIVIHYTAGNGDSAKNEANYFANGNQRSAGAHFFVDQQGEVYLSVKMERVAWAVGGSKYPSCSVTGGGTYYGACTNYNSVSIELCDNLNKDPSDKQIKVTKELVAYIQNKCSNAKTIIRHFDVSGKTCPARMAPTSKADKSSKNAKWESFKKKIIGGKATSSDSKKEKTKTSTKERKVKVNVGALNVRKKPDGNSPVVTVIRKGEVYTIVSETNGWGKLKSGIGYIKLKYTKEA